MGGIVAAGPGAHQALQELTRLLTEDARLTNVSLGDAQYLLSTLGPLAGGAAQLLAQRIDELQAAADRAADAASRMRDEAASMLDEIDQLEGNQESIEDRRHDKKLQDLAEEAQAAGTQNSQGYRELVDLENRLHDLKVRNLQKQAAEKQKADEEAAARERAAAQPKAEETAATTSGNGPALGTIKFDIGNGQQVSVRGTKETAADLQALMKVLEQQRRLQPGVRG
jgi:chromosome segregation ATPase